MEILLIQISSFFTDGTTIVEELVIFNNHGREVFYINDPVYAHDGDNSNQNSIFLHLLHNLKLIIPPI